MPSAVSLWAVQVVSDTFGPWYVPNSLLHAPLPAPCGCVWCLGPALGMGTQVGGPSPRGGVLANESRFRRIRQRCHTTSRNSRSSMLLQTFKHHPPDQVPWRTDMPRRIDRWMDGWLLVGLMS